MSNKIKTGIMKNRSNFIPISSSRDDNSKYGNNNIDNDKLS